MKMNISGAIVLFFASVSLFSAQVPQVVKGFEDPLKGTDGFYIAEGENVADLSRIDHPTYGGILEAAVSVNDTGSFIAQIDAFDNGWTEESEGPAFVTVDVFVPEDFPNNSVFYFWQENPAGSQRKYVSYSPSFLDGGRAMIQGAWNTFTFDLRRFAQISGDTYDPANPVKSK